MENLITTKQEQRWWRWETRVPSPGQQESLANANVKRATAVHV